MQSNKQNSILNISQKSILIIFFAIAICSLFLFSNLFFKPTLLLKSFGELSMDPKIAFENNKPTFLEFYAEWCEVCKEMAPKISLLKKEYERDINFVFLNVDNPKWENYIRKFKVNGIPQVNIFDEKGNLKASFIGKQEENIIQKSLENFNQEVKYVEETSISDLSRGKEIKKYKVSPRTH
tara:strand:+ start:270 stop:812 length:543 start_codon:yes stop_codon:yes gene_type:complete